MTNDPSRPLKRPSASVPGRIYFIQGMGGGPIKIGFSAEVPERLKTLQSGSPVPLVVVGTIPGTVRDEWAWHQRFAADRMHGEWFAPTPQLGKAIGLEADSNWDIVRASASLSAKLLDRKPKMIPGRYWPLATTAFALMGSDNAYISAQDLSVCAGVHRNRAATCLTFLVRNRWLELSYVEGRATTFYRRRRPA